MTASAFFGEYDIGSTNKTITVDGTDGNLTEGSYYIYHPTDSLSLVDQVTTLMTSLHGATVSASISTAGLITFSASATFTFDLNQIETIFGFSGAQTGSNSYTGSTYLRYCWFPHSNSVPIMHCTDLAPFDRQGIRKPDFAQSTAVDGTTRTSHWDELYYQTIVFKYIDRDRTWNQNDDYRSLEEFWEDVLSQGTKLVWLPEFSTETYYWRYYPDLNTMKKFNPTLSGKTYSLGYNFEIALIGVT